MQAPDLDSLYREVVLDHYRNPRGQDPVPEPAIRGEGQNPLCGDETRLAVKIENGRIEKIQVRGMGCSISVASASMMAEILEGKTVAEARRILEAFKGLMHGKPLPEDLDLGDLVALDGVKRFPVRIKCVLLAWTTLEEALKDELREAEGSQGGV